MSAKRFFYVSAGFVLLLALFYGCGVHRARVQENATIVAAAHEYAADSIGRVYRDDEIWRYLTQVPALGSPVDIETFGEAQCGLAEVRG